MAITPGSAPPSTNRLEAFMASKRPTADIAKFNQDPQAAAVMEWLNTPEAQEFLRRIVMEHGLMDRPGPGAPAGPGPGAGGPPSGPGPVSPGPAGPGAPPAIPRRPGAHRPPPGPPRTAPGMGPSPAPGVPGGERDLSDPASFGPQGAHPLAGIGGAIAGAFQSDQPFYHEGSGQFLYPGDPGYPGGGQRDQLVKQLAASQRGPRFGPPR